MSNSFKIKIPQLCHENWDAMQPKGCGRFCNSCEQTVVDFTQWSDEEFVSFFQSNKTIPCGRFTQRQLQLDIPSERQTIFHFGKMYKYVAASILAATTLSAKAQAQQAFQIEEHAKSVAAQSSGEQADTVVKMQLKGRVLDERGDEVIVAQINLKGTGIVCYTDVDGTFILEPTEWKSSYMIHVKSLGYVDREVEVILGENNAIVLEYTDAIYLTEIAAYGRPYISKPNLWQRITKPFRKK